MQADDAHRTAYRRLGGSCDDPALRALGWHIDGDTVALRYAIDGLGELTETVRFPDIDLAERMDSATAGAIDLLHLAALTSYVKAAIPRRVIVPTTDPAALAMLEALLDHGLAEFAAVNDLDLSDWFEVVADPDVALADNRDVVDVGTADGSPAGGVLTGGGPTGGVLVPVGGGKDSAVTAMLAVRAGLDATAFAVNPRPSMQRTAEATGLELLAAERRLDPTLLAWNDAGALNGHVPITAIVASIACVAAMLTGRGDVLMSNEGSADEPTRTVDGRPVNHQYSKTAAFEALHGAAMRAATGGATRALSVLRPLPELVVAACFVQLGAPLHAVNSCNRAYSLTGQRTEWCGRCPKCLFVELMLAPFMTPSAFREATGFDALADPQLTERFADLTDAARKPFECVGTVEEVQLALDLLADDPAWRDHPAVTALGRPDADATARFAAMVAAVDTSSLPGRYAAPLQD
ncbi:MAG: hypothetical protein ACLFRD_05855, partial [Nitriliruptoraceae bacterium]